MGQRGGAVVRTQWTCGWRWSRGVTWSRPDIAVYVVVSGDGDFVHILR